MNTPTVTPGSGVVLDIRPYGDSAVLVTARQGDAPERWQAAHAIAAATRNHAPAGVCDAIPAYDSVLIGIDIARTTHAEVETWVRQTWARHPDITPSQPRVFRIPVVYGGEFGPDLDEVAHQLQLSVDQVVEAHTRANWVVRLMGAPVGAPMMDGSPFPAPVSRCPEPRTRIPAGSVGLAGRQAVVYPVLTPGGWRLIGRTPLCLVDAGHSPPSPYRPGDIFRFEPIDATDWSSYEGLRPEPSHG